MPPYVPHKRLRSPSSNKTSPRDKQRKTAVFDAVDARDPVASADARRTFLDALDASDSSHLSSSDDDDHPPKSNGVRPPSSSSSPSKRRKLDHSKVSDNDHGEDSDESEEEEDEDENPWDNFLQSHDKRQEEGSEEEDPVAKKNIEISLGDHPEDLSTVTSTLNSKKRGPSKRDRQIRSSAHALHVQSLLYHNYLRNHWLSDKKLHKTLRSVMTESCKEEVERWRKSCARMLGKEVINVDDDAAQSPSRTKRKKPVKGGNKGKNPRDWGSKAAPAEDDPTANLNHSDPLLRLLKALSSFWKKRFNINAPGLRKEGYKTVPRLGKEFKAWQANANDQANFGERIESLEEFLERAKTAEGSRDVGAQLFTAMLRAVGLEARLVCNLQPTGFGWSKSEEADPPKKKDELASPEKPSKTTKSPKASKTASKSSAPKPTPSRSQPVRKDKTRAGGTRDVPIDLSDDDSPLSTPPESDSEESVVDITHSKSIPTVKRYDRDLPFPIYWTEVLSPLSHTWIPVDPIVLSRVVNDRNSLSIFEPRGAGADRAKQILAYVVAFNPDGSAKDVTTRYMKNHTWPGKTKGVRVPIEKVPIYNKRGRVRKYEEYDWFKHVLSLYTRRDGKRTTADDIEDEKDLKPVQPQRDPNKAAGEETLQGYKNSAEFVLERHLRREEAIKTRCSAIKTFRTGKGDAAKDEPVYKRADVVRCKTVESWHKEGREVKEGEQPLKRVPMRAVTTIRKREIEATERETGEKMKQGLFSQEQTDWIIPPPIEDGVIPKNAFGNIDVYVPTMVPKGAAHVPLRGTPKVCRKLGIDFAEACTGFEFGNRMAVPVLTGVVVAAENRRAVVDAWRAEQEIIKKREADKREKLVLGSWRRMLTGLRVIERVRREYGDDADKHLEQEMKTEMGKANRGRKGGAATSNKGKKRPSARGTAKATENADSALDEDVDMPMPDADADLGGGFIPEGQTVEILDRPFAGHPPDDDQNDGDGNDDMAGGFILEHEDDDDAADTKGALGSSTGTGMQSLRERMASGQQDDAAKGGVDDMDVGVDLALDTDPDEEEKIDIRNDRRSSGKSASKSRTPASKSKKPANKATKSATEPKTPAARPTPARKGKRPSRAAPSSPSLSDMDLDDDGGDTNRDDDDGEDQDDEEDEEEGPIARPTQSSRKSQNQSQKSKYFRSSTSKTDAIDGRDAVESDDDDEPPDDSSEDDGSDENASDFAQGNKTSSARVTPRGRARGRARGRGRGDRGQGSGGGSTRSSARKKT